MGFPVLGGADFVLWIRRDDAASPGRLVASALPRPDWTFPASFSIRGRKFRRVDGAHRGSDAFATRDGSGRLIGFFVDQIGPRSVFDRLERAGGVRGVTLNGYNEAHDCYGVVFELADSDRVEQDLGGDYLMTLYRDDRRDVAFHVSLRCDPGELAFELASMDPTSDAAGGG